MATDCSSKSRGEPINFALEGARLNVALSEPLDTTGKWAFNLKINRLLKRSSGFDDRWRQDTESDIEVLAAECWTCTGLAFTRPTGFVCRVEKVRNFLVESSGTVHVFSDQESALLRKYTSSMEVRYVGCYAVRRSMARRTMPLRCVRPPACR